MEIIKKIDNSGRIVLPSAVLSQCDFGANSLVKIDLFTLNGEKAIIIYREDEVK